MLFQRSTCRRLIEWYRHCFRGPLQWSSIFSRTVFLWKKHLAVILFFKGIELIRNSNYRCIHLMNCPFLNIEEQLQSRILSKLLYFFRNRSCCKKMSLLSAMINPWFVYIKLSCQLLYLYCCLTTSVAAIRSFYGTVIISRKHLKESIMLRPLFILQHLLQVSIITSGLWLFRKNLKGTVFIWGKLL